MIKTYNVWWCEPCLNCGGAGNICQMTGTWSPPPAWTLTSGGWTTTSRQSRRWSAMRRTYSSTRLSPRHRGGSSPASSPPATSLWVKQNSVSSSKLFLESRKVKALSYRQQKLSNIDLNLNQLAFLQGQASKSLKIIYQL